LIRKVYFIELLVDIGYLAQKEKSVRTEVEAAGHGAIIENIEIAASLLKELTEKI